MKSFLSSRSLRLSACALAAGASLLAPVRAEDIDIYGNGSSGGASNILFFIDNTSNWSANAQAWNAQDSYAKCVSDANALSGDAKTAYLAECKTNIENIFYYGIPTTGSSALKRPWESGFASNKDNVKLMQGQVELRALRYILNKLVCSGASDAIHVNVGLAFFNDAGTVRSNGDIGGYIRQTIRPLAGTATTAGSTCKTLIDDLSTIDASITTPDFKGPSSADYGSAMFEVFKYFGGYTNPDLAAAGTAGTPVGAQGYGPVRYSKPTAREDVAAFTDSSKTTYRGPSAESGACGQNYLVLIGNAYPNAEPNAGAARFQGLNYTPKQLSADVTRYADEWSQFLATTDVSSAGGKQPVYSYVMDVFFDKQDLSQTKLLSSMANVGGMGGSGYIKVGGNLNDLVNGLGDILISAAAVDSVFTATTLPVSTTTQGSYLNQLFIGMFRPDAAAGPRWVGNLKQYKLGMTSTGELQVQSSDSKAAILPSTGYFAPTATSFWTADSVFFHNNPMGTPLSENDSPDGQIVEKGGVAQRLREANASNADGRKVYTLPTNPTTGAQLSATPFTSSNGAVTSVFSADMIKWIRGENNIAAGADGAEYNGAYKSGSSYVDYGTRGPRPSIHGDILHSRPVALNYGSSRVVVFYGSNDGFLHAVDGRQSRADGGGSELWSFIAPEHYGMFKRQHDDEPVLWLPSTNSSGGTAAKIVSESLKKDYAMDGPIGVFALYDNTATVKEAIIYAAMRRGGNAVYAFDVSEPESPKVKFKITNSGDYARLGQTWSLPRAVAFPASYSTDPIVIMGGGYDPSEDTNTSSGVGNVVYVINGRTGARLAALATDWSVPGDVTVVDTNFDGVYDRGYVADVRGNLYRIDFFSGGVWLPPASWTITKIASLGGKVFYAPDVIPTRDFVAVLLGTGDREKPLMTASQDNFFLIKDTVIGGTARTSALATGDLTQVAHATVTADADGNEVHAIVTDNASVSDAEGCYIRLAPGEKVVNAPYSVVGATYFGTNRPTASTPSAGQCSSGSLGAAYSYQFPLFCGVPTSTEIEGGGLPPSPVGGLVTLDDGTVVSFIIGSGANNSALDAKRPRPPIPNKRKKTYWHVEKQNR